MTILSALNTHYGRLERCGGVAPFGFSTESIAFALVLSPDGGLNSCRDLRDHTGRQPVGRAVTVPRSSKRSGTTPRAFFLWDNSKFVLGLGNGPARPGVTIYAAHAAAFRETHERLLDDAADPGLLAVLRFMRTWAPSRFGEYRLASALLDRNLVFQLDGDVDADGQARFVHDRPAARAVWERQVCESGRPSAVCLVTGRIAPVARLHPLIKGVAGARLSGASLVSFNRNAFASYGKEQGDNAPVSEAAASSYGAALNALLARNSGTKMRFGDTTTVFWADASVCGETSARKAEAVVACALGVSRAPAAYAAAFEGGWEGGDGFPEGIHIRRALERIDADLDPGTRIHILGLSPNGPRLAVRLWHETTLDVLLARLAEHWEDLRIEPRAWHRPPSPLALLQPVARRGDPETVPPVLGGEMMRAILTGGRYPRILLTAVLQRLRAGEPVTGPRAAIIRAVLQRDVRHCGGGRQAAPSFTTGMEVPVSLDRQEADPAYRLGRLFALLDNVQRAALGRVNASIRDRYLGAASATPASIFPLLLRNTSYHLAVLRRKSGTGGLAIWFEREMNEVMAGLDMTLPRHLHAESQGRFLVGYYHQRCARKPTRDAAKADIAVPDLPTDEG
ncbi:type I-C CRISPR-associated protein Cas8c/Csd1 [Azospirillum formosense]|uniref:Type I-C CRISPR-associated protein Cas8c/Csd1 n=1 Tax=Azospirillum formosense TaxID=861533 RepID=A0ABX2KR63_9PROT|nr:type I-C CRISPR-associated protein Cas8c/Csd1 [Azospirillum formosense]MBY3753873.1 type I-C CRISPR-associated protein Cas8c/Csd1 [Azospirillum formosense]NUB18625.1 type I-C CRISPR-associated protein Cas8c/Csd1 [Azospirillum formosense]